MRKRVLIIAILTICVILCIVSTAVFLQQYSDTDDQTLSASTELTETGIELPTETTTQQNVTRPTETTSTYEETTQDRSVQTNDYNYTVKDKTNDFIENVSEAEEELNNKHYVILDSNNEISTEDATSEGLTDNPTNPSESEVVTETSAEAPTETPKIIVTNTEHFNIVNQGGSIATMCDQYASIMITISEVTEEVDSIEDYTLNKIRNEFSLYVDYKARDIPREATKIGEPLENYQDYITVTYPEDFTHMYSLQLLRNEGITLSYGYTRIVEVYNSSQNAFVLYATIRCSDGRLIQVTVTEISDNDDDLLNHLIEVTNDGIYLTK